MTYNNNTHFGEGELEALLVELTKLSIAKNYIDPYNCFIDQCRGKTFSDTERTEIHHILPRHAGGSNDSSNLIRLSVTDHMIAHWLLWQLRDSKPDRLAFSFQVSQPADRQALRMEHIKANVQKYKEENRLFYNKAYQSAQGKKGGTKGGSANSEAQFAARQIVGQEWGPKVGRKNQSSELKEFLTKYSIWDFKGFIARPLSSSQDCIEVAFYAVVKPKDTFKQVAESLNLFAPESISIKQVATMHKLLKNNHKRIYGWRLNNTLTRSEVETGALKTLPFIFVTEE